VGHADSVGATQARDLLVETTARILRDLAEPQAVVNAKDEAWRKNLWRALEDAGLTRAWVPESLDGAGASLADGFEILRHRCQLAT